MGPIPWSSIVKFGELHGMDIDDIQELNHHIRAIEAAEAEFENKKEQKGTK